MKYEKHSYKKLIKRKEKKPLTGEQKKLRKERIRGKEIKVKFTIEEHAEAKKLAVGSGYPYIAPYMRDLALAIPPRILVLEISKLIKELNRIGNNLNQITKLCHQRGEPVPKSIGEIREEMEKLNDKVFELW